MLVCRSSCLNLEFWGIDHVCKRCSLNWQPHSHKFVYILAKSNEFELIAWKCIFVYKYGLVISKDIGKFKKRKEKKCGDEYIILLKIVREGLRSDQ